VTALSASASGLARAAAATVTYVCGPDPVLANAAVEAGPARYYADSTVEGPGRWLGQGAPRLGLGGAVRREDLEALLRGEDPVSGAQLLETRRASVETVVGGEGWVRDEYTFSEAAGLLGVDASHLRRVAGRTLALLNRTGGSVETLAQVEADSRAFLVAERGDDGRWRVSRVELERFATQRRIDNVVSAYDVTFSAPKSVSVLWACADEPTRQAIVDAIDRAVDAGITFLESECAFFGRGEGRLPGRGLSAAAFTHATSRNLDPQLHVHVLVANAVETPAGGRRALDGAGLFAYAKTAGYLAAATLRHELTKRLGVSWRSVSSGIAEIDGVPQTALERMSSRSAEIDARAAALEVTTARGRQAVALATRNAKPEHADLASLRDDWRVDLAAVGFDAEQARASLGTSTPRAVDAAEISQLFSDLARHDGLTAHAPTFDHRDVIQAIVDWAGDRLDAPAIESLAEEFLASSLAIPLDSETAARSRARLTRRNGRAAPGVPIPAFTTPLLVAAECQVLGAFRAGLRADVAIVPDVVLHDAVDAERGLAREQRDAIHRLCRSGDRVQCLVGPAGAGKTYTVRTAARAWTESGTTVVGLAVQGSAAETLTHATGIPTETVAAFLARADRHEPDHPTLNDRSVVVVDEASALGTFELARLTHLTRASDAKLVLVGDPAQHSSVAAGGAFAALVRHHPDAAAHLEQTHRHQDTMANARIALDELRHRDTDVALHRLVVDERVSDSVNPDAAYDALVHDWYQDRVARQTDPSRARSSMITERHHTRRELIERARTVLQEAGELTGPSIQIGGQEFQVGDEVMCRAPARDLHPDGQHDLYLRNGTYGTVTELNEPDRSDAPSGLWVQCPGRERIFVPAAALTVEIRPGVTGVLTHSYALTSHAAQGATFETARALATESTSPAALYVSASRARSDLRLYTTRLDPWRDPDTERLGPPRSDGRGGLQALASSLRNRVDEMLAIELDPALTRLSEDPLLDGFASRSRRTPTAGHDAAAQAAVTGSPEPAVPEL
jgi:conjugative relaxase-like TrwC/TraI family protein